MEQEQKITLQQSDFTKWMSRHLVAIVGTFHYLKDGKPDGDEQLYCFPGFVIEVNGVWCYVTAGHNFNDFFEEYVRIGHIRVNKSSFMDFFGPDALVKLQTYFDYDDEPKVPLEARHLGLDFGIMPLRDLFQKGLEANRIVPFQRKNWIGADDMEFEFYGMLGTPAELRASKSRQGEKVSQIGAEITVTFVPISKIDVVPDSIDAPTGNWFIGKVNSPFNMEGMSGSPVFGFKRNADGRWEYRPVAVQSRWFKDHRIIYACPISPVMMVFEGNLEAFFDEHERT